MFVYTPPSWHPVLFSATPSQPREVSGGGRAEASSAGSFIHGPSPPFSFPRQQRSAPLTSPRNSPLVWVCNAGIGRKRPRDIPRVAAIWCLSPPPAVPPTHKFTHSWSGASSMLWELKPNGRVTMPPQGHAALCEQEPKTVCRKPALSAREAAPGPLRPQPFCKHFWFLRVMNAHCTENSSGTKSSTLMTVLQGL